VLFFYVPKNPLLFFGATERLYVFSVVARARLGFDIAVCLQVPFPSIYHFIPWYAACAQTDAVNVPVWCEMGD
jgi:hypothetical protein